MLLIVFNVWLGCQYVLSAPSMRLAGDSQIAGRLEVFHEGSWGTVCDDAFDRNDAIVACRTLGYATLHPIPYSNAHFGQGSGTIWMDDMTCTGQETSFFDCKFNGWGNHNCQHSEDASVDCNYNAIRLVGGSNPWEGRLEVFHGVWGTVCDDGFDTNDAQVVCNILGYPNRGAVAYSSSYFGQGTGSIWMDDLGCHGYETDIASCSFSGWGRHNCHHTEDVAVSCSLTGHVRLTGGSLPWEGRLEVFNNGRWGTVCSREFDVADARVFCAMLGYNTEYPRIYNSDKFGTGSGPVMLEKINCTVDDRVLRDCDFPGWEITSCSHTEDVGISCVPQLLQLASGRGPWEGRVEVFHDNKWGSVCDANFDNTDALKVCTVLGFKSTDIEAIPVLRSQFGASRHHIWLDKIDCITGDGVLSHCTSSDWTTHTCDHNHEAGVICQLKNKPVRLVNGAHSMEGRVEVSFNNQWYSLCDDYINKDDANAICNLLSTYPLSRQVTGTVFKNSFFGSGKGPILTSHIPWNYGGLSINPSFFQWQKEAQCDNQHTAGVSCSVTTTDHLINSRYSVQPEGTLQVHFNSTMFTICDEGFDSEDATTICRKLGYWSSSPTTFYNAWFGRGNGTALRIDPECAGNEPDIVFCRAENLWNTQQCSHSHDVGVSCSPTPLGMDNVRIVPNDRVGRGRLEVKYNGHWGSFCLNHWNQVNSMVACKTLRYTANNPTSFPTQRDFSSVTVGNLQCQGKESDIGMCRAELYKVGCSGEVVGIDCTDDIKVRLVNGGSSMAGRVEVFANGAWGSVPYVDLDTNLNNAKVVCKMLGYSTSNPILDSTASGPVMHNLALANLNCDGWEEHIKQCHYSGGGLQESNVLFVNCFSCFYQHTGNSGEITSPSYPGNYDKNTDCLYAITPNDNHFYKLVFNDIDLADGGDSIEVRENPLGEELDVISNAHTSPSIISGKTFWIRFRTNEQLNARGFRIYWNELTIADTVQSECTQTSWNIKLNMTLLWNLYPSSKVRDIFLSTSNCTGEVFGDQMLFTDLLSNCGTTSKVNGQTTTYSNSLYDSRIRWMAPVQCNIT